MGHAFRHAAQAAPAGGFRQPGRFLPDGRYELRLPYSSSRELLMDVLRYGPDATIVEPVSLRAEAQIRLRLALGNYGG